MGSVGPDLEAVYQAGCDMTEFFLDKGAGNIVIMSGGASVGNRLHSGQNLGNAQHAGRKSRTCTSGIGRRTFKNR